VERGVIKFFFAASNSLDDFLRSRPEALIEALVAALALTLYLLLISLRNQRRLNEQVRSLRTHVSQLELSQLEQPLAAPLEQPLVGALESRAAPAETVVKVEKEVVVKETAISRGLQKSRAGFISRLAGLFSGRATVDTATLDELEELLILSDVGARCAGDLVEQVRQEALSGANGLTPTELTNLLKEGIRNRLVSAPIDREIYRPTKSPLIVLVVGVNGVGKTTTVAKLATKYMQQGKKVLAVAADTFRAAAVEQLAEWSSRVGFTLVRGNENAKPSAVVFDGMLAAKEGAFDVVLIDTAGRLHTKSNLMQELEGVRNSIRKHFPDGPHETVLVLDGVSGQNALSQAREFNQAVALTGIVVTKLDGTPKGGIIVAISEELQIPVFYIGVGEKVADLLEFSADDFVNALFNEDVRALPQEEIASRASNQ
jgi:fused signal recognition particle receptor